jgi:hypothetical protein
MDSEIDYAYSPITLTWFIASLLFYHLHLAYSIFGKVLKLVYAHSPLQSFDVLMGVSGTTGFYY